MPFTLSHIAAVLPFMRSRRPRWSATGLILGSVTPDFEKFLRLGAHNGYSHSWASLAYFSCPVALGLAFAFHGVVRKPLLAHLPRPLRRRLARFQGFAWGAYFRQHPGQVVASILLGAATHLLWDSFTHRQSPLVTLWPLLRRALHLGPVWAPVFVVVNLLSSVGGLGLVLAAVRRLPAAPVPPVPPGALVRYWGTVGSGGLLMLASQLALANHPLKDIEVIIIAISGLLIGLLLASGGYGLRHWAGRWPGTS